MSELAAYRLAFYIHRFSRSRYDVKVLKHRTGHFIVSIGKRITLSPDFTAINLPVEVVKEMRKRDLIDSDGKYTFLNTGGRI